MRAMMLRFARRLSVSGTVYAGPSGAPHVTLFTKLDCTLCEDAKQELAAAATQRPHTLEVRRRF